jgi:hypothetical protein
MAPEAGEGGVGAFRLCTRQLGEPRAVDAHLEAVAGEGVPGDRGAAVRRADRDDVPRPLDIAFDRTPGADREAAHAVADEQGRHAGGRLEARNRRLDHGPIASIEPNGGSSVTATKERRSP